MNKWTDIQIKTVASLAFAIVFGLVSFVLGFGIFLSAASAVIGVVSGAAFISQSSCESESSSQSVLLGSLRTSGRERARGVEARPIQDSKPAGPGHIAGVLAILSGVFLVGSPYQRVATRVFLSQAMIGAVAILLFWIAQAAGFNVALMKSASLEGLFAKSFVFGEGEIAAKIRFEGLFLPLASLYAISFLAFTAAFLGSLGTILRSPKQYWSFLFVPVLVLSLSGAFLYPGSSPHRLQKLIVDGHVLGYVAVFVFYPLFCLILTAALPNSHSR